MYLNKNKALFTKTVRKKKSNKLKKIKDTRSVSSKAFGYHVKSELQCCRLGFWPYSRVGSGRGRGLHMRTAVGD